VASGGHPLLGGGGQRAAVGVDAVQTA